MKKCSKCKTIKKNLEFYKNKAKPDGLATWCKKCTSKSQKPYNARISPGSRSNYSRAHNLRVKYGITIEDYERMAKSQNQRCAICKNTCSTGKRLCVDHDHKTGRIRGLLCRRCNYGLGLFGDNPSTHRAAATYLRVPKTE